MARESKWVAPVPSYDLSAALVNMQRLISDPRHPLTKAQKAQLFMDLVNAENDSIRRDLRPLWELGNPYRYQMSLMRRAPGTPRSYLYAVPGVGGVHQFGRHSLAIVDEERNVNCILRTDTRFDPSDDFLLFRLKITGTSPLAQVMAAAQDQWFVWHFQRRKARRLNRTTKAKLNPEDPMEAKWIAEERKPAFLELSEFSSPLGCDPQFQYSASPLEFAVLQGLATALLRELTIQAMKAFSFTPRDLLKIHAYSLRRTTDHSRIQRAFRRAQTSRLKQFYHHHFGLPLNSEYVRIDTFLQTSTPPVLRPRLDAQVLSEFYADQLTEDMDDPMMTESSASSEEEEGVSTDHEESSTDEDIPLRTRGGHDRVIKVQKKADADFTFSAGF